MGPIRPIGPICLILLAAFPALAADVNWDTIIRLTTNAASQATGYSSQHSVAIDAAANVHVVWLDQRTVPYQIWYRRYDAGMREWLAETTLTTRPANCFRPGIACDSAGNVHVAWHVESFMGPGIWAKRYNAGTHHWRADTLIDTTTTARLQLYPSVACVPVSGDVDVAWYGLPDSGLYVQVSVGEWRSATGWDSALQVSEALTNHDQVSVAAGENGDLAVVWIGRDLGDEFSQVYCRRRVGAAWQGIELVSAIPLALTQHSPCVAFDADGAVHIVWHGLTLNSGYLQVFHRTRGGGGWSGIDTISGTRPYQQQYPSIACDAAGRCHAVWCSQAGGTRMQLAYAQRDTDGGWTSPTILTGLDSGSVSYPSITANADSGIHIVWSDDHAGNPDVYYLRGVIPGSGAIEERIRGRAPSLSPEATIARSVSLSRQSGVRMFDACGRSATDLRPGVYFVRVPDRSRFRRMVVVP